MKEETLQGMPQKFFKTIIGNIIGLPWWLSGKESASSAWELKLWSPCIAATEGHAP